LQRYQSPSYHSAGYNTPTNQAIGYGGSGTHSLDYNTPRTHTTGFGGSSTHSLGYNALGSQTNGYGASSAHPAGYQTPAATYQHTAYGTSGYGTSGHHSAGYQTPPNPPTGYGGPGYHSAGIHTPAWQQTGYGACSFQSPGFHSAGYQASAYQHGAPSYQSPTSGAYQKDGYSSTRYLASGPAGAPVGRLYSAPATLQTTPTSTGMQITSYSSSGYSSGELQSSSDYGYYPVEVAEQPLRQPRSFLAREHPTLKDILITKSKITRNLVRIYESYDVNGNAYRTYGDEFREGNYDLVEHLKQMNEVCDFCLFPLHFNFSLDVTHFN
jgi:hypothetical protein